MRRLHLLCVILAGVLLPVAAAEKLPRVSPRLSGYADSEAVGQRLQAAGMHRVEGVWQMADDGAVFAVERSHPDSPDAYRLVIIDSPDRSVRPGTVMGYAWPTARADYYDARIYTAASLSGSDDGLIRPQRFTLRLADGGCRLSIEKVKSTLRLDLRRVIPYLYRVTVTRQSNRPSELDGAVRVGTAPGTAPLNPCYL